MIRTSDLAQVGRGFLMGGADIVPGVSGGTVALILGIYDRLVRAISHVDATLLGHIRRREWKAAATHLDLGFLVTLGIGIVLGIVGLASLMHYLLEDQEYISIHSIDRNASVVRLNVGTSSGGVEVGTVLPVYRSAGDGRSYQEIGSLRLEKYVGEQTSGTTRLAIAVPVGDTQIAEIRPDDVVMQPSQRRPLTLAAFFGLILGSTILVGRMIGRWNVAAVLIAIAGAAAAYWLVGLLPVAPDKSNASLFLLYLFGCGMVAICAMILPGISGAFILLLLGVYTDVTKLLRDVLHRQATPHTFVAIAVFVSGCAIGLVSFSKLLNWLLIRHRDATIACLCGFMAGSLRKIWPFKLDLTPNEREFKFKLFENVWPEQFDGRVWLTLGIMAGATFFVIVLDMLSNRRPRTRKTIRDREEAGRAE